jgi:hypothetical protein
MKKIILLSLSIFLTVFIFSQERFKIMSYNALNLFSTATDRFPYFKKIFDEVQPDILALQEVSTAAALNALRTNALNGTYACAPFIDGPDTDRCLCYKLNKFSLVSHVAIPTNLRHINLFTLINLATSDTLRVFVVHLKASDSANDATARNLEIQKLREVTNQYTLDQHFIVTGDFNFYRSTEPAYQLLKNVNDTQNGYVIDPIDMPGEWGVFNYRQHHTQSPRAESFGGGVAGGLDDRFDLVLYSKSIANPGGLDYVPNSTIPYGNDGNHYNMSINVMPNTAVSQEIADALYYASDHLPVIAEFIYNPPLDINETDFLNVKIFPNPAENKLFIESEEMISNVRIISLTGETIILEENNLSKTIEINVEMLKNGIYFVELIFENNILTRKISIK